MEWRESGGNPHAFRRERHKDGSPVLDKHGVPLTGVGQFQITNPELKGSHTTDELFEPELNTRIAARYIKYLVAKYGVDFPKISAAYNAGSVQESGKNPWGMVQTDGHVSSEVAALNYYLLRSVPAAEHPLFEAMAEMVRAQQFDLTQDVPELEFMSRETDPAPEMPEEPPTNPEMAALPPKKEDT
jgi:hypothetical protein